MSTADVEESRNSTTVEDMNKQEERSDVDVERAQEAELRSKYPNVKGPGASALLQKRLSKGNKYFDSGDYYKAKAATAPAKTAPAQTALAPTAPAQELPTAPPDRKLFMPVDGIEPPTGTTIPTPEIVAQRKSGLQQSKLVSAS